MAGLVIPPNQFRNSVVHLRMGRVFWGLLATLAITAPFCFSAGLGRNSLTLDI